MVAFGDHCLPLQDSLSRVNNACEAHLKRNQSSLCGPGADTDVHVMLIRGVEGGGGAWGFVVS